MIHSAVKRKKVSILNSTSMAITKVVGKLNIKLLLLNQDRIHLELIEETVISYINDFEDE